MQTNSVAMTGHTCANCRRPISASMALTSRFCDKCQWAAGSAEFRADTKTDPRRIVPLAVLIRS